MVGGEHSSKELFIWTAYYYLFRTSTCEPATWLPPVHVFTWTIHEHTWAVLRCMLNSTFKSFNPEYWHQTLASLHIRIHSQARQILPGSQLWRDLTKVISILNWGSQDWHVSARNRTWAFIVRGEHWSKELLKQGINCYSEHLLMRRWHYIII